MSVWVTFPTTNPARAIETIKAWAAQGYRIAVLVDKPEHAKEMLSSHFLDRVLLVSRYEGYFRSMNMLARMLMPEAECVVHASDDIYPDLTKSAYEIAGEFLEKFPDGFGVMQPTGDKLKGTDKICGSPWVGKAWIRQAYGGHGAYHPAYFHFYGDEELLEVAREGDILWQRDDLTQRHDHWTVPGVPKQPYQNHNSKVYWDGDKTTFMKRQANKFPMEYVV